MGKGTTRRKAARKKAKERAHGHRADHEPSITALIDAAVASSFRATPKPGRPRTELLTALADHPEKADRALSAALITAVTTGWQRHWQPADLHRALAHVCSAAHARLLSEAIRREVRSYGPGAIPPRWQAQLDAIDAGAHGDNLNLGLMDDHDCAWVLPARRDDPTLLDQLAIAIEALTFLRSLRPLAKIGPLPGESGHHHGGESSVDPAVLHRVTSLLAKAESTSFPQEAEALTAKAQELMARHAIDRALVEARRRDRTSGPIVEARRLGIEAPYGPAKAILLQHIAAANRCRAVWDKAYAYSTVFGADDDLDTVEMLYTSLLVQSARAMLGASRPQPAGGRTRSFRQSFLISFAARIGDRLREAVAEAVDATDSTRRADLLPVLANREADADQACRATFPHVKRTETAANNPLGWQAGRDAADRAQLGLNDSIHKGGDDTTMDKALERGAA